MTHFFLNLGKAYKPFMYCIFTAVATTPNFASAVSCMVLGQPNAIVSTPEGEKSPLFLSQACEELRLVEGEAMASWVNKEGKAKLIPITEAGIADLPKPGAEERSSRVVWEEMTKTRETHRAAYMRVLTTSRPSLYYVPRKVVYLAAPGEGVVSIHQLTEGSELEVLTKPVANGELLSLTRDILQPAATYRLAWSNGVNDSSTTLKTLDPTKQMVIDQEWDSIEQMLSDRRQQEVMVAMMFDQLKLRLNSLLALEGEYPKLELPKAADGR